jgi:hypothetical protein
VLHHWRFAIDAAVVLTVGIAVAALVPGSISWTAAGGLAFAAVFLGGVCAPGYRRAIARALLATGAALVVALASLSIDAGDLADSFDSTDSAPSLAFFLALFTAGTLIPAVLTALVAHSVAVGWRTRDGADGI